MPARAKFSYVSEAKTGKLVASVMSQEDNTQDMSYLPLLSDEYRLIQEDARGISESPQFLEQLLYNGSENQTNMLSINSEEEHDYKCHPIPMFSGARSMNNHSPVSSDTKAFYQQGSPQNSEPQFPPSGFTHLNSVYPPAPISRNGLPSPISLPSSSPTRGSAVSRGPRMSTHSPTALNFPHLPSAGGLVGDPLPETSNFPGSYGFQLSFGPPTNGATKSIDYTYSHKLGKLYVQKGAQCPFKFKTAQRPPSGCYIKILPVFKGTHVLSEPVRRCSNHAETEDDGQPRYHFMRSNNMAVKYETSDSGRLYATIPYSGPQVGAEYQNELFSFMCFNSCGNSSHAKRRIDVIFTLETEMGEVLGRQVIEVRVCACPGRDRSNEEGSNPSTTRRRKGSAQQQPLRPRKRQKSGSAQETFTITITNPIVYELLRSMQVTIEKALDGSIPELHSPASSTASSPGTAGTAIRESSSDEEE